MLHNNRFKGCRLIKLTCYFNEDSDTPLKTGGFPTTKPCRILAPEID